MHFLAGSPPYGIFAEHRVFSQEYERTVDDFVTAQARSQRQNSLFFAVFY